MRNATKCLRLVLMIGVVGLLGSRWATADDRERLLDQAERLIAQEQPGEALAVIQRAVGRTKPGGRALLLRSTARFMQGEHEPATADLRRALELDPTLRQGWLNLAAVEMAVERWDAAYAALVAARDLAPEASDNDLNLGAVQLLRGRRDEAAGHFATYLKRHATEPEAFLQVASNYALAGDAGKAIDHLAKAIALNERIRLRIRADRKFDFFHLEHFRRLMNTDSHRIPADARQVAAAFRARYDRQDRTFLDAVLDSLTDRRIRYEPTIEANEDWALIWGDLRIKVTNQDNGTGVVQISAPADRFSDDAWHRTTQDLFRTIHERLSAHRAAGAPRP